MFKWQNLRRVTNILPNSRTTPWGAAHYIYLSISWKVIRNYLWLIFLYRKKRWPVSLATEKYDSVQNLIQSCGTHVAWYFFFQSDFTLVFQKLVHFQRTENNASHSWQDLERLKGLEACYRITASGCIAVTMNLRL